MNSQQNKPRRFQFSLRAFLLSVCILGVFLGLASIAYRNHRLDSHFESLAVNRDYDDFGSSPIHLLKRGKRFFCHTCQVNAENLSGVKLAPNLQTLTIVGPLDTPGIVDDVRTLRTLKKLRSVILVIAPMDDPRVVQEFARLSQLEKLSIQVTQINADSLSTILKGTGVRHLELMQFQLSKALIDVIGGQPAITFLHLRDDDSHQPGSAAKIKTDPNALSGLRNATQLRTLLISDVNAKTSGEWLGQLRQLHTLELSNLAVDQATCEALSQIKSLKRLSLARTSFDDTMINSIEALKDLEFFDASYTQITDGGAERIDAFDWIEERFTHAANALVIGRSRIFSADGRWLDATTATPVWGSTICSDGSYLDWRSTPDPSHGSLS